MKKIKIQYAVSDSKISTCLELRITPTTTSSMISSTLKLYFGIEPSDQLLIYVISDGDSTSCKKRIIESNEFLAEIIPDEETVYLMSKSNYSVIL